MDKKKTLIIPCMGGRMIDGVPLYLKTHPCGDKIARKCIEGLPYSLFDDIYVVYPKEDIDDHHADHILSSAFADLNNVSFLPLTKTGNAVETVRLTIEEAGISGMIVIKDINNCIELAESDIGYANFIAGVDLDQIGQDIHDLHKMSFISLNENDSVMDIVEKRICSEHVGVGLYGFSNSEDFLFAVDRLNDKRYPLKKIYISHIVSYMIGYRESVFHYIRTKSYECWNDERSWGEMQRNRALYFIDLDHLFATDFNDFVSKESVSVLRKMSDRGASFIGFTVKGEEAKSRIKRVFENAGVSFLQVVFGCPVTSERRLIRNKKDMMDFYYYV